MSLLIRVITFSINFHKDFLREREEIESLDKTPRTCLSIFVFVFLFIFSKDCECFCYFKNLLYKVRFKCVSLLHCNPYFPTTNDSIHSMEGENIKTISQDLVRLDCFDDSNFTRWQDKVRFLLTEHKIFDMIDHTLAPLSEPMEDDTPELVATRKKREEDKLISRVHILNIIR